MGRLLYSAITSLDGYVADANGTFDWATPDDEVHAFVNELERPIGTYLYGRRMYEVMAAWETLPLADASPVMREYAELWRQADKVVYSRTLDAVSAPKTLLVHDFEPDAVRALKEAAPHDLSIGGPGLAGEAIAGGLVDEISLFLTPVAVGGGTPALPPNVRIDLELLEERRFASGVVYVRYRARNRSISERTRG